MARVAIGLGSNLGDRQRHIDFALAQLAAHVSDLRVSTVRETDPFDVPAPQPSYLNAVVVGETSLGPQALMGELMVIERRALRRRPSPRAPRTLDLDLILFDNLVLDTPSLVIPHAGFRERRFVLEPLAELEPEWQDPVTGKTVQELLKDLQAR